MTQRTQATQETDPRDLIVQRLQLYTRGLGMPASEAERIVAEVLEADTKGQPDAGSSHHALARAMARLHACLAGEDAGSGTAMVVRSALARTRLGYGGSPATTQPPRRSRVMLSFPPVRRISMVPERRGPKNGPIGHALRRGSVY